MVVTGTGLDRTGLVKETTLIVKNAGCNVT